MWKESTDKVHIFWEGHIILQNLHQLFVLCTATQIIGGDFAKFCGLLRIYELYYKTTRPQLESLEAASNCAGA